MHPATPPSGVTEALEKGDLITANALLGRPYRLTGLVIQGNQLGRTLGFPTANLQTDPEVPFLLPTGVYAVRASAGGEWFPGMANAGFRPTLNGKDWTLEVHLIGFSGDLYGKKLEVDFISRLRDERKFGSSGELAAQIRADQQAALDLLT